MENINLCISAWKHAQILDFLPNWNPEAAVETFRPHNLLRATLMNRSRNQKIANNFRESSKNETSKLMKLFSSDSPRFELEELRGLYVALSKDQHGSRFIQKEMEVVDLDVIQLVFEEVLPVICDLMVDVYGNYVVQKFFDFGTEEQKILLSRKLQGHVCALSLHLYGCRVIQKALDTFPCHLQV